ncbi:MAG: hypothetical protein ACOYBP_08930 [Microbacteriaceae bacterium]
MADKSAVDLELEQLNAELLKAMIETPDEEQARKQRELTDKKALLKAFKEHGRTKVHAVYTPLGLVIVKTPGLALWRSQATNENAMERADAIVMGSLVHPTLAEYRKIEEAYPGTPQTLLILCSALAGHGHETTLSK